MEWMHPIYIDRGTKVWIWRGADFLLHYDQIIFLPRLPTMYIIPKCV